MTEDEEFREFIRGRWPAMLRLAYGLTGDRGRAEDVAQAAFARAYASWGRVRRTGDPDAYVRRILINENRRRFRKHRVAEDLPGVLKEPAAPSRAARWTCRTCGSRARRCLSGNSPPRSG